MAANLLNGYRLLWMLVMFDLPVGTKAQQKAATKFRESLLDQGFEMSQFSVYMRFCNGREQVETYIKRIEQALPKHGKVHVFTITDKQYETSRTYHGRATSRPSNPGQLDLF